MTSSNDMPIYSAHEAISALRLLAKQCHDLTEDGLYSDIEKFILDQEDLINSLEFEVKFVWRNF